MSRATIAAWCCGVVVGVALTWPAQRGGVAVFSVGNDRQDTHILTCGIGYGQRWCADITHEVPMGTLRNLKVQMDMRPERVCRPWWWRP